MVGITITILPIKQNVPYPKQEAKNQDKKKTQRNKKAKSGFVTYFRLHRAPNNFVYPTL